MGRPDSKVQVFQAVGLLAILIVFGILAWDYHGGMLNSPGGGASADSKPPTRIMEILKGHQPPELLLWAETWQSTHPSTRPSEDRPTPETLQHLKDMIAASDLSALE